MQIIIKCGGEGCSREFKGDTEERSWLCPYCDHEIENKHYPFLSARLMEGKRVPEETDWRDLFDLILRKARLKMMEANLRRMEEGLEKTSLSLLIEYEDLLDSPEELDFQQKTLEAVERLGCQVREMEKDLKEQ